MNQQIDKLIASLAESFGCVRELQIISQNDANFQFFTEIERSLQSAKESANKIILE